LKLTYQPTDYANPYPNRVIALSDDERYLVNGTDSAYVQVFDINEKTSRPVRTVRGFNGGTNDIQFLRDKKEFIVASGDYKSTTFHLSKVNLQTGERSVLVTLPSEA